MGHEGCVHSGATQAYSKAHMRGVQKEEAQAEVIEVCRWGGWCVALGQGQNNGRQRSLYLRRDLSKEGTCG